MTSRSPASSSPSSSSSPSPSPAPSPTLVVRPTREAAEGVVADFLAASIRQSAGIVLGLATGRSMVGVYRRLVEAHRAGELSFARTRSFNLDEWCGLAPTHPASFAAYMRNHLFGHVDIAPAAWHLPAAGAPDAGPAYEAAIAAAGGIDVQLLGIGRNGHIGFNEPGSARTSRTRIVTLDASTRAAAAGDFPPGESVPQTAMTMGVATILEARRIVLLATGAAKAEALAAALEGPETPANPASFLKSHPRVSIVADRAAAAHLATPRPGARPDA